MRSQIVSRLEQRFALYTSLLEQVDGELLGRTLDVPRHKSLRDHLWCCVGARESFTTAIAAGEWQGFACSMTAYGATDFAAALTTSADNCLQVLASTEDWTETRDGLLARLSEHEVMHEGQIIRHMFALGEAMPAASQWA